eukprot:8774097-Pyramimonas_sp.AAC.1
MHALPLVHLLKRPENLADVLLFSSKLRKVGGASLAAIMPPAMPSRTTLQRWQVKMDLMMMMMMMMMY